MEINVNVRLSAEPELARALETIADAVAAIRITQCCQNEPLPKTEKNETPALQEAPKKGEAPKVEEPKDEPKAEGPKEAESAPQANPPAPKEDKKKLATKKKPVPKKEEEPKAEEPKEEEAKQEELDTATDDGPAPTPEVTRDEVIALGKKLTKAGKKVAALFKDTYGVTRFADITDDQLPEVYEKFKEMDE
ncbi:MAG: hypothetical protein IJ712_05565 [Anaerovibrio sp.]|nr:hypothetical protein [Anaerovibrio sp.]